MKILKVIRIGFSTVSCFWNSKMGKDVAIHPATKNLVRKQEWEWLLGRIFEGKAFYLPLTVALVNKNKFRVILALSTGWLSVFRRLFRIKRIGCA